MNFLLNYPETYRIKETSRIITAAAAGESISLVGLSGAGKSNLLGFLSSQYHPLVNFIYIDGNRLQGSNCQYLLLLLISSLNKELKPEPETIFLTLENEIQKFFNQNRKKLCLVIDRFDMLNNDEIKRCGANLRAIRDQFKYRLSYVIATRQPIPLDNELSELFFGNTIWLGPLTVEDSYWSINQFCDRKNLNWNLAEFQKIFSFSLGYPSFLRAICEAFANGCPLRIDDLLENPIMNNRISEFLQDQPTAEMLKLSGLESHPFLLRNIKNQDLTEKEYLLLTCLKNNSGELIDKDNIIKSVWPEDQVFQEGIRDDSLAQLIRRLRRKLEKDPRNSFKIVTVTGRGYKIIQEKMTNL